MCKDYCAVSFSKKKKKKRLTKGFSCVSKLSIIICHMFIDKK